MASNEAADAWEASGADDHAESTMILQRANEGMPDAATLSHEEISNVWGGIGSLQKKARMSGYSEGEFQKMLGTPPIWAGVPPNVDVKTINDTARMANTVHEAAVRDEKTFNEATHDTLTRDDLAAADWMPNSSKRLSLFADQAAQMTMANQRMSLGGPKPEEPAQGAFGQAQIDPEFLRRVGHATVEMAKSAFGSIDRLMANGIVDPEHMTPEQMHDVGVGLSFYAPAYARALTVDTVGELGMAGGRASLAKHLSAAELQEMNQLLKAHPDKAEEIRASYGIEQRDEEGPKVSATLNKQEQPQRLMPSALPETPPVRTDTHSPGESSGRALDEEMIDYARQARQAGRQWKEISEELGVASSTIRRRLQEGYTPRTADESYRLRPNTSPLNDSKIRQHMLNMKRDGETDLDIAKDVQKRFFNDNQRVTEKQVEGQLRAMRNRFTLGVGDTGASPLSQPNVSQMIMQQFRIGNSYGIIANQVKRQWGIDVTAADIKSHIGTLRSKGQFLSAGVPVPPNEHAEEQMKTAGVHDNAIRATLAKAFAEFGAH